MIQLTYEAAFDPCNTVFRLTRLRPTVIDARPLEEDHVRILDFYLLFPFRIGEIRLKPKDQKYKKLSSKYDFTKPYGNLPSGQDIFQRMRSVQLAALDTLAAGEWIGEPSLHRGIVEATQKPLPKKMRETAQLANKREEDLIAFLNILASEYSLLGPDGLKARTGLLEYRYDAV